MLADEFSLPKFKRKGFQVPSTFPLVLIPCITTCVDRRGCISRNVFIALNKCTCACNQSASEISVLSTHKASYTESRISNYCKYFLKQQTSEGDSECQKPHGQEHQNHGVEEKATAV